jgi:hypothetical protein
VTPVLADAGFFVALYNRRERMHRRCVEAYQLLDGPLATCEACITEAFHLSGHATAMVECLLASIAQGALSISFHLDQHTAEIQELMKKYRDTPANFADACLIQMAEELGTGDILTLDSDFKHYRWRRNRSFNLLIPLD